MKPRIGIVICAVEQDRQFVPTSYIQAVKTSGGLPFLIPLVKSNTAISEYVTCCDGFLFCGGGDITPILFGQEPKAGLRTTDFSLDLFQIRLMKKILESQKPLLAICRGMQILNVACGGTVIQDLTQRDDIINHMQTSQQRKDISHRVQFLPHTKLHHYLGPFAYTNSFHHQAIEALGVGCEIAGTTGDGIIEAIEMPSHPFVIGVQWHPESMFDSSSHMRMLFHAFILAAK